MRQGCNPQCRALCLSTGKLFQSGGQAGRYLAECFDGAYTAGFEIDDGRRVVPGKQVLWWQMDFLVGQVCQFRQPLTDKAAVGVKAAGLGEWVKHAKIGNSIGAGGGAPLPAAIVGSQVAINQVLHKPVLAQPPVQ